ncbi:hypothetical protein OH768_07690 [Streptomyces sp. NBC_01622]|uniref:hypothetical protein n=1 Tax=Streptomyces sp. NBC_01622 TaxID=2975903 RepID=UPI0038651D2E|nr:hypothetical protein OH768_07690 [Streptomyces sp. NBC_01622]
MPTPQQNKELALTAFGTLFGKGATTRLRRRSGPRTVFGAAGTPRRDRTPRAESTSGLPMTGDHFPPSRAR